MNAIFLKRYFFFIKNHFNIRTFLCLRIALGTNNSYNFTVKVFKNGFPIMFADVHVKELVFRITFAPEV